LLANKTFKSGNLGFVFLDQVSRLRVFVETTFLVFADPHPDQMPLNIVAFCQAVQGPARKIFLRDVTLKCGGRKGR
jgi:hypothetical protein